MKYFLKLTYTLVFLVFFSSCTVIQPIFDKYFGNKVNSKAEALLIDQTPPAGYDPHFILGKKDFNSVLIDPYLSISRIEANKGGNVKVFFQIIDEDVMLTGATDLKNKICKVVDSINGKEYLIKNYKIREITEKERKNMAYAIVMDHSGSMGNERAIVMQNAVAKVLDNKFDNDLVSLIRYDHKTNVISDLKKSKDELKNVHLINGLAGMGGGTETLLALEDAIKILSGYDDSYTKTIIVFTDGLNYNTANMNNVISNALKNNIFINAIDYGFNITPDFLETIAYKTNGMYHHIYLTNEFDYVFEDINYRLNNFYVLEFEQSDFGDHKLYLQFCLENDTLSASKDFNNVPLPGSISLLNVYFDTGKSNLKKESDEALKRLEMLLKSNKDLKIEIWGHTDNVGKPEENLKLSEERSESVKKELISRGISDSRISTHGYGDTKPIADNDTKEGKQLNRRTEFVIK